MGKFRDLTGQKFGRLTVIERAENIGNKTAWRCVCECGKEAVVRGDSLTSSNTQSCGCWNYDKPPKNLAKDLTGMRFGRLVVIERLPNKGNRVVWKCKCDCGRETVTQGYSLTSGKTKSCGCLSADTLAKIRFKDLTGKRFGMLTVLKEAPRGANNQIRYLCRCDCGNETTVYASNLRNNSTQSCGCKKTVGASARNLQRYIGERFGRLTVIDGAGIDKNSHIHLKCVCDCGKECIVSSTHLVSGMTTSCGCYRSEKITEMKTKHGMYKSRLSAIRFDMIQRCTNPKSNAWEYYGGRGIRVCDEWLNDPVAFFTWALNNGYSDELSIDRIDVNGNYCPENCRWATPKQQGHNKRSNHIVTVGNESYCMTEWAEITGLSVQTISKRLQMGWPAEAAVYAPKGTHIEDWLISHPAI